MANNAADTQETGKEKAPVNEVRTSLLKGMYEGYFLDYASYVILERAVPAIEDGFKPVQRRILHAMKEMDDGRFHKVANIIGQTMQYHPHGDAAIGDALVNLGQHNLLIETQGNWGDVRTGDSAAAARYIEARLSKFALEVTFNPQTTRWQLTYDGRKKEPVTLPVKFPLLLAQGVEGIAVGLSTKILPHNFNELIKASIKLLQGKQVTLYPDFQTGGFVDVTDYQGGKRGGRVKVRARIEKTDAKTLTIRELPYGVTTTSLIDSVIKAGEKGKIKIKKITDNTAAEVEVVIELVPGTSPDLTIDALYAFTACETPISPNACVIINEKPHFLTVEEILRVNTENTRKLLGLELQILLHELEEKLHFASLEKIFIEKRIYRDIEECESWEEVMPAIVTGLRKYVRTPDQAAEPADNRLVLLRNISEDDITRLTEIRIRRISKYNSFKADELIAKLLEELKQTRYHLEHLTEFAIDYYQRLLDKYGKGRERRTEITSFDTIQATEVVANNAKLYVNRKEGFVGMGLKKDEFVVDCSDIDDVIVFRQDGKFVVTRIADKTFVGKDIIHVDVWKKNDERTTYNLIYLDGKTGRSMVKRFNVTAITRDKEYDLTTGEKHSKLLYFSANANGEAEIVTIGLTQSAKARIKQFDFDFGIIAIKGRSSQGNILTRYPVRKITMKEAGKSTLGAMRVWMDEVSGRLNTDGRGQLLGAFDTGDQLLVIYKEGAYELTEFDLSKRFDPNEVSLVAKFDPQMVVSAIYFEGGKGVTLLKRFQIETSSLNQKFLFISDNKQSKLYLATVAADPLVTYAFKTKTAKEEALLRPAEFIDVKGWKAMGNKLCEFKLLSAKVVDENPQEGEEDIGLVPDDGDTDTTAVITGTTAFHAGDTIEFDVEDNGQAKLF